MTSSLATKTDLRKSSRRPLVSTEEGDNLSHSIHANKFVECSAKENYHIQQAIHEAVRAAVKGPIAVPEVKKTRKRTIFTSCCQS